MPHRLSKLCMAKQRPKQTATKREENRSTESKEKRKVKQEAIQRLKAAQITNLSGSALALFISDPLTHRLDQPNCPTVKETDGAFHKEDGSTGRSNAASASSSSTTSGATTSHTPYGYSTADGCFHPDARDYEHRKRPAASGEFSGARPPGMPTMAAASNTHSKSKH